MCNDSLLAATHETHYRDNSGVTSELAVQQILFLLFILIKTLAPPIPVNTLLALIILLHILFPNVKNELQQNRQDTSVQDKNHIKNHILITTSESLAVKLIKCEDNLLNLVRHVM